MSTGLIDIMKRASLSAMDNAQMCDLRYGTVVSTSPLRIQVTNVLTIPAALLVVPRHLTNYTVSVRLDDEYKEMRVNNALKTGDKVALLRKQGGQSYFILDRI